MFYFLDKSFESADKLFFYLLIITWKESEKNSSSYIIKVRSYNCTHHEFSIIRYK